MKTRLPWQSPWAGAAAGTGRHVLLRSTLAPCLRDQDSALLRAADAMPWFAENKGPTYIPQSQEDQSPAHFWRCVGGQRQEYIVFF